jgi:hypothetical protein
MNQSLSWLHGVQGVVSSNLAAPTNLPLIYQRVNSPLRGYRYSLVFIDLNRFNRVCAVAVGRIWEASDLAPAMPGVA